MNDLTPLEEAEALLRGITTLTETPLLVPRTTGRSGAQTYEVVAGSRRFMLKLDARGRSTLRWKESLRIQQAAAARGVAPPVLAWNERTRAVLTDYVQQVPFLGAVFDPTQSDAVFAALAESVAALHAVDPRTFAPHVSPLDQSREMLTRAATRFEVPAFATRVWRDLMRRKPVSSQEALCHLDLNPSNILFDGRKIWLVDWDTAGPGDRWLDVSTIANMLLLDAARTNSWIRRYTELAGIAPPEQAVLSQARRVSYAGYGCAFLDLVASPPQLPTPQLQTLADCYAALQRGELDMNADSGRWQLSAAYFAAYWEVA